MRGELAPQYTKVTRLEDGSYEAYNPELDKRKVYKTEEDRQMTMVQAKIRAVEDLGRGVDIRGHNGDKDMPKLMKALEALAPADDDVSDAGGGKRKARRGQKKAA